MQSLVSAVRTHEDAAASLACPGDFDLDRGDHFEEVHLASYAALEGFGNARAYLVRCMDVSIDSRVTVEAGLFLSDVLRVTGDADGAERQLMDVLEQTGENAEARFRLGELYAEKGDGVRARAEWRRARDVDPSHLRAIARLSM